MLKSTMRRVALGGLALLVAAGIAVTTAGTATAADFPFSSCKALNYHYIDANGKRVEARYSHYQGGRYHYKLYVNGKQPNPNNPADQANWASCIPT